VRQDVEPHSDDVYAHQLRGRRERHNFPAIFQADDAYEAVQDLRIELSDHLRKIRDIEETFEHMRRPLRIQRVGWHAGDLRADHSSTMT